MAADKRAHDGALSFPVTKIHKIGNTIVGVAGELDHCLVLLDWFRGGRDPEKWPAVQATDNWVRLMYVLETGECYEINKVCFPIRVERRFHAIGSGAELAIASMHLGETAAGAVAIASEYDPSCGEGIDVLSFKEPRPPAAKGDVFIGEGKLWTQE